MEIRILKTELVDWRSIEPLQPANFKHIYNYKHIERSILENGFVNPFFVWENEGIIYSIDGVTRKEILSNLENVPDLLPAVFIDAKNRQDAVKILLSVFNTKENPIDLEVLTEWVNIEQVEVEVTSLNVVDMAEIEENEEHEKNVDEITNMIACKLNDKETEIWLTIKEKLGIKKDKNAIFALIKNYSHETDIN